MDRKAVPQVMQAGLIASAVGPSHPGVLAETGEGLLHDLDGYRRSPAQHQERCVRVLRMPRLFSLDCLCR